MGSGTSDSLDFSEPVDAFSMGHGRLVVATGRQARVYAISSTSGATLMPAATVDISDMLLDIKLAARCFLLLLATSGPQVRRLLHLNVFSALVHPGPKRCQTNFTRKLLTAVRGGQMTLDCTRDLISYSVTLVPSGHGVSASRAGPKHRIRPLPLSVALIAGV